LHWKRRHVLIKRKRKKNLKKLERDIKLCIYILNPSKLEIDGHQNIYYIRTSKYSYKLLIKRKRKDTEETQNGLYI